MPCSLVVTLLKQRALRNWTLSRNLMLRDGKACSPLPATEGASFREKQLVSPFGRKLKHHDTICSGSLDQ